jgi:hypothetical protein
MKDMLRRLLVVSQIFSVMALLFGILGIVNGNRQMVEGGHTNNSILIDVGSDTAKFGATSLICGISGVIVIMIVQYIAFDELNPIKLYQKRR